MPIYTAFCPACKTDKEIFSKTMIEGDVACPDCGLFIPKAVSVPGHRPFKSYVTDALCPEPGRSIEITSRDQERRLCKQLGCERAS